MDFEDKIQILVIEDNKTVHYVINKLLNASTIWKFEIDTAMTMTALTKLKSEKYHIVLSDLELPDSYRSSTLRILKNELPDLPYIILTATDDDQLLLESIESGAENYLCKEYLQQGALLSRSLYNAIQHWEVKSQLKYIASHDELTGALNKRQFMKILSKTIERSNSLNETFCLAICDLDNFRDVNNNYGHIMGDKALKAFVAAIKGTIRDLDFMGRFGGDEFCIIFLNTEKNKCQQYLKKLSSLEIKIPLEGDKSKSILINGSYGGVQYIKGMSPEEIIIKADKALYEVKENGKGHSKVL